MSNLNQTHWTEDEELLERYVLGRLDRPSREALNEHLIQCDTCRQAVKREQLLAAGIRRMGRDSLRTRLAGQVGASRLRIVPWTRIIAAAAIIVIVAGVGTYYRWFAIQRQPDVPEAVFSDKIVPEDQKSASEENFLLHMGDSTGADASASRQELPASRKQPAGEEGSLRLQSLEAPTRESDDYRSNEEAIARDAALEADAKKTKHPEPVLNEVVTATGMSGSASYAAKADASTPSESPSVLWIDGLMLADNEAGRRTASELETMSDLRKDETTREAPKAGARGRVEVQRTMDHYRVMQRPLSELPLSQQTRQQYLGGKTVQTEVQRMKDGVQLILFTDVSLDTLRGGHPVVQQVGRDSLIVQINSHRIVYRLPEGWYDTNARPD